MDHGTDETAFEAEATFEEPILELEGGHPLASIVLQIEIMGVLGRWWR